MDLIRISRPFARICSKVYSSHCWRGVRFLCYHSITPEEPVPEKTFTPTLTKDAFRLQMQMIKDSGATVVSMGNALELLKNGEADKGRYVCITFDDGYLDNWNAAWPILKEYRFAAHFFIVSDWIGIAQKITRNGRVFDVSCMGAEILKKIMSEGGSMGSHSASHKDFTKLGTGELLNELKSSKEKMEILLGTKIITISYPYTFFNTDVETAAREAGYKYGFTIEMGSVKSRDIKNPFQLRRTVVANNEAEAGFELKVSGGYDWSRFYSLMKRKFRR